jgi:nucleotide-binding universal stress UspA family protein
MENLTPSVLRPVRFAQILASVNQAQITLLHVCQPRTSQSKIAWIRSQMEVIGSKVTPPNLPVEIEIVRDQNVTQAILKAAQSHDLVVLPALRRRVGANSLALGEVTTPLVQQLTCSIVLLGEPQETLTTVLATK